MKKIILFPAKCEISMSGRVVYKPFSYSLELGAISVRLGRITLLIVMGSTWSYKVSRNQIHLLMVPFHLKLLLVGSLVIHDISS